MPLPYKGRWSYMATQTLQFYTIIQIIFPKENGNNRLFHKKRAVPSPHNPRWLGWTHHDYSSGHLTTNIEEQNSAFKALPPRKQVSNLMNPRTHHLGKVGKVIEESGTLEKFEVVVLADFMLHLWRYQDLVCSQKIPRSWWRIFFTETVATHWNKPVFGRHGFLEWPVTTWRRTHHKRPGQELASILKGF